MDEFSSVLYVACIGLLYAVVAYAVETYSGFAWGFVAAVIGILVVVIMGRKLQSELL